MLNNDKKYTDFSLATNYRLRSDADTRHDQLRLVNIEIYYFGARKRLALVCEKVASERDIKRVVRNEALKAKLPYRTQLFVRHYLHGTHEFIYTLQ